MVYKSYEKFKRSMERFGDEFAKIAVTSYVKGEMKEDDMAMVKCLCDVADSYMNLCKEEALVMDRLERLLNETDKKD